MAADATRARARGGAGRQGAGIRYASDVRKKGRYFTLRTGRGKDRRSIPLGYVSEDEAQRAVATLLNERDQGSDARVWALYDRDRAAAIKYLLGDPGVAKLLPDVEKDWSRATLAAYFAEVYAPWRAEAKPQSWRQESGFWRRILASSLGSMRLRDIDDRDVADYLEGLVMERARGERPVGTPVSGRTKSLHRSAVQGLLNRAYRLRHLAERVSLGEVRIEGSTRRSDAQVDPLNLDELLALLDACKPPQRALFAVGAGMGLRPSELVRVRWEDVDLGDGTLAVRGSKTDAATASIPLTPLAVEEIRSWWVRCGQPTEGHLFLSRLGTPYPDKGSPYKKSLAVAARRAGIERSVTPYLLRHSFATIAWSVGVPKDVARRILRHTDEKMLDDVYTRPRPAELAERLAAFRFGA